jgi:hypothetical protein
MPGLFIALVCLILKDKSEVKHRIIIHELNAFITGGVDGV